ncbi:hypothetical protein BJV77DRAFT_1053253 [Russula vinacea]|nr:hypothetical protein BJV77DRAFT_1053253 [Russula vinacea]
MQTMWKLNAANPINEHISRALDLEHSCAPSPNSFQSYRVFLSSAVGSDIILASPL